MQATVNLLRGQLHVCENLPTTRLFRFLSTRASRGGASVGAGGAAAPLPLGTPLEPPKPLPVSRITPAKSFLGSRTQRTQNNHHMNTRELVLQLAVFSVLDSLIYRKLTTERENERQGWVFAPVHERATTTLYLG